MPVAVRDLSIEQLRELIHATVRESLEEHLEDFLALHSSEFVRSVAEAREDYKAGRVTALEDLIDG